jgi:hypothetical protein
LSGGYRNPTIRLDFPDLAKEGDRVFVVIRNPRTMPTAELRSAGGKVSKEDQERYEAAAAVVEAGGEVPDGTDEDESRGFSLMAKLVIAWRVWDTRVPVKVDLETGDLIDDDETAPRLLPLPATPSLVGQLPPEIINAIGEQLKKINPQARTPAPADGTSNPS